MTAQADDGVGSARALPTTRAAALRCVPNLTTPGSKAAEGSTDTLERRCCLHVELESGGVAGSVAGVPGGSCFQTLW